MCAVTFKTIRAEEIHKIEIKLLDINFTDVGPSNHKYDQNEEIAEPEPTIKSKEQQMVEKTSLTTAFALVGGVIMGESLENALATAQHQRNDSTSSNNSMSTPLLNNSNGGNEYENNKSDALLCGCCIIS